MSSDIEKPMSQRKYLFKWLGWFSIFNYLFFVILIGRYLKYTNEIENFTTLLYMIGTVLGHSISLVFLVFLILYFPLILIIPRPRIVKSICILSSTMGVILLLLDYEIYSQYRFHINGMVLELVFKGGKQIFDFSWVTYLVAVVFIIITISSETFISKISSNIAQSSFRLKFKGLIIAFYILLIPGIHVGHMFADAKYYRPITTITKHIPLFMPLTGKRFLLYHGYVDLNENWKINKLSKSKNRNSEVKYPISPLKFEKSEPLNIIYLLIDSWRFDTLNSVVTPNMDRFVKEKPTLNFQNHTSSGNGSRVGVFGFFYGLFGTYWNSMETNQTGSLLIKSLIDHKYQMGIFTSSDLITPAFNQTVFSDVENLRLESIGNSGWEKDLNIMDDWDKWYKKRDRKKPYFTFLFFDSAHKYAYPPNYKKVFDNVAERVDYHKFNNEYDPTPIFNKYKTAVHFIDSLVGKVLSKIEKSGDLKNTVIVISGDHGQEFNDNKRNFWGHGSNYTKFQIKVPLIIYWPGKKETKYNHLTNHIDITPTIMKGVLGCSNPYSDYSNGRSLFNKSDRRWIFSGGGLSTNAIIEKDRITEILYTGGYEIFAPDYSILKDADLDPTIFKEVIKEQSRFYK